MTDFKEYKRKLSAMRSDKQSIKDKFFFESELLKYDLERFRGQKLDCINFNDINDTFPINKWIRLTDQIKFIKTAFTETMIKIDLLMCKGSKIGWHYHGDCVEVIKVESGEFADLHAKKIYKKGEIAIFEAKQEHTPLAKEDCILKIEINRV